MSSDRYSSAKSALLRRHDRSVGGDPGVAVHRHAMSLEGLQSLRNKGIRDVGVHQQGFHRIADRGPLSLGVDHDLQRLLLIGARVDEEVTVADAGLDHRHLAVADDGVDQSGAAPRDQHVDQAAGRHQVRCDLSWSAAPTGWRRPATRLRPVRPAGPRPPPHWNPRPTTSHAAARRFPTSGRCHRHRRSRSGGPRR